MAEDLLNEIGGAGNETGQEFADDMFADKEIVDSEEPQGGETKQEEPKEEPKPKENGKKQDDPGKDDSPKLSSFAQERFLKKAEDGSSAFDAEGALSFMKPKSGNLSFEYKPKIKPAENTEPKEPEKPVNPYQARMEARREYEKGLRENGHLWPNKYSEAIKNGYQPAEAVQIANNAVREWMDSQVSDWQWKQEQEEAEKKGSEEMTRKQMAEAERSAATNEQAYINYFGDKAAYDRFMFGRMVKPGEYEKGYAQDFIYKMYEMQNPDKLQPTSKDYQNWWNRFASDPSNLQLAYTFGMGNLMMELMPHMIQKGAKTASENERQKTMAQRRPRGMESSASNPGEGGMAADLQGFLQPPDMGGEIDTI